MSSALPRNVLKAEVMKTECSAKNSVITFRKEKWIKENGRRWESVPRSAWLVVKWEGNYDWSYMAGPIVQG